MRNNGGRVGLATFALLIVTACAEEPPVVADPTPSTSPSSETATEGPTEAVTEPPTGSASGVTLIDAGAEPRQELRLELEEGDAQTARMTMRMKVGVKVNGEKAPAQDLPAMTTDMNIDITNVSDDGTITASFSYGDVGAEGDGEVAREMEKALASLRGVGGTYRLTSRGEYLDGDVDLPADLPKALATTMKSFKDQMKNFAVPFPAEAVGKGASWEVDVSTEVNGIKAETTYRYELVRFTEDGAELRVAMEQTADSQPVDPPGVPPSVNVFVDSFAMEGAGHSTVSFGSLLPLSSTMVASGGSEMSMWDSKNTVEMVQDMEFIVTLEGD